ncbi:DNA/RNA non-specific endonuclease [Vallicoccus soli]|uniref:DNA/RNA non-specific endonuclease n=1 Tax=Vallicoccus soli TaxID=2339232 RepID=A0A3A3YUH5_9ACTN|nr:DNA/RNA non-specific endonuclease [Vallicoccus soli]
MDGLDGRGGYDPAFLGVDVPLPVPTDGAGLVELAYEHFTVLLRPDRRLAAATAVGIDGASLRDVPRGDDWRLDPRVPAEHQADDALYRRNDLDRGHLVRRRDPVWGEEAVARRANADTFHFTNAAPQHAGFNQSKELWVGLEDHLLEHAAAYDRRLVVLTGPVLAPDDPVHRGVGVPLRFWKVAAALDGEGALTSTAYVLDQSPLVEDLPRALRAAQERGDPPPLGPFRTFQVPVAQVAALTALDLGPLPAADLLPVPAGLRDRADVPWVPLGSYGDVVLRR